MTKEKEYLSDWFKEGLKEIGLSEATYQKLSAKGKNEIKKTLAAFGHF